MKQLPRVLVLSLLSMAAFSCTSGAACDVDRRDPGCSDTPAVRAPSIPHYKPPLTWEAESEGLHQTRLQYAPEEPEFPLILVDANESVSGSVPNLVYDAVEQLDGVDVHYATSGTSPSAFFVLDGIYYQILILADPNRASKIVAQDLLRSISQKFVSD